MFFFKLLEELEASKKEAELERVKKEEKQKLFEKQTQLIVEKATTILQGAVEEKRDLIEVFHHLLSHLSDERTRIALEQDGNNNNQFGKRRDRTENFHGPCSLTSLSGQYKKFNIQLLGILQSHLKNMDHTLREFREKNKVITLPSSMGRENSIEIKILTAEDSSSWGCLHTEEDCRKLHAKISTIPFDQFVDDPSKYMVALFNNMAMVLKLKQIAPDDYKKIKLLASILHIQEKFPDTKKSDWALVTRRMEVNGKMYALTQYLTWMYRDFKTDPIEHMTDRSIITLIHQDCFIIEDMLSDIAKLFKQIIEWDGADVQVLINNCALLQYELAHAMPCRRGSATISEWLEMTIYEYHGFECHYTQPSKVNVDALILPLKEFVETYPSLIELRKIPSNSPALSR